MSAPRSFLDNWSRLAKSKIDNSSAKKLNYAFVLIAVFVAIGAATVRLIPGAVGTALGVVLGLCAALFAFLSHLMTRVRDSHAADEKAAAAAALASANTKIAEQAQKLLPRRLTDVQKAVLRNVASPFHGKPIVIITPPGDPEVEDYLNDFRQVLESGGHKIHHSTMQLFGGAMRGCSVLVNPTDIQTNNVSHVQPFVTELLRVGVLTVAGTRNSSVPRGGVGIQIGAKIP